jgi:hypothetical protein
MQQHRLWITGWPQSLGESALTAKLSSFGRVVGDVSVTRKLTAEGETNIFAHLTLEAGEDALRKCLRALNRSTWFSSVLRVERANEHYTERLRREACSTDDDDTRMPAPRAEGDAAWGLVGLEQHESISQLRVSNPALPRAKRRRGTVLVRLGVEPSTAHARFDEHGKLGSPGQAHVWSIARAAPAEHKQSTISRCDSAGQEQSGQGREIVVDHGYVRDVGLVSPSCSPVVSTAPPIL